MKVNNKANGVIMVYDVTNRSSFESLPEWLEEIKEHGGSDVEIIICGNKIDLESKRMVSEEEGLNWAQDNNIRFFETSAKTNTQDCVNEAFQSVINCVAEIVIFESRRELEREIMIQRKTTIRMETFDSKGTCC